MELHKLTAEEVRSWDRDRLTEAESEIRLELANVRVDIYSAKSQSVSKVKGFKKSLARLMTVKTEQSVKKAETPAT